MMVRATPVSLGNTKEGFCVVISIAKTDSGPNTAIFVREIDKDGFGVGGPFRLASSNTFGKTKKSSRKKFALVQ